VALGGDDSGSNFHGPRDPGNQWKTKTRSRTEQSFSGDLLHLQRRQPQCRWRNRRLALCH
ncbi:hypothetical protein S83_066721, partial [Arachis hypogaea]